MHVNYCTNKSSTVEVHMPIVTRCDTPVPGKSQYLRICHEWPKWVYTFKIVPQPKHTRISLGGGKGQHYVLAKQTINS